MEYNEIVGKLNEYSEMGVSQQGPHREEIDRLFRRFLKCDPLRAEFEKVIDGLLITPGIMWEIYKGKRND